MRSYRNILYVSHGVSDERGGLRQALSVARNNGAALTVLVLTPEFPRDLPQHEESFVHLVHENVRASLADVRSALGLSEDAVAVNTELMTDQTPAVAVIRQVLQKGYDLVVKEADVRAKAGGFKAIDMDLLRKCPVPVWLCRPIDAPREAMKIAVAIDPVCDNDAAQHLSVRLLQLADELAQSCDGRLQILSCWDYALESTLKHSGFIKISADEVDAKVEEARASHLEALERLVAQADITPGHHVHHLRGEATEHLPRGVQEHGIDILVMGTVARTGIAGFMIGNTAENVIQQLSCSLLACKPGGFVSPVTL